MYEIEIEMLDINIVEWFSIQYTTVPRCRIDVTNVLDIYTDTDIESFNLLRFPQH